MRASSSGSKRVFLRAARFLAICSGRLAPMRTEVMRLSRRIQARAISARDWPRAAATALRARSLACNCGVTSLCLEKAGGLGGAGIGGDVVEVFVGEQALGQGAEGDAADAEAAEGVEEALFGGADEHRILGLVDQEAMAH